MWEHLSPYCTSRHLYDELACGIRSALQQAQALDGVPRETMGAHTLLIMALAQQLITALHQDNPQFNEARFRQLAGLPRG